MGTGHNLHVVSRDWEGGKNVRPKMESTSLQCATILLAWQNGWLAAKREYVEATYFESHFEPYLKIWCTGHDSEPGCGDKGLGSRRVVSI